MISLSLYCIDDCSTHFFTFNSIQEIQQSYGLSDLEINEFLKGYKINPDRSDFILYLISKD